MASAPSSPKARPMFPLSRIILLAVLAIMLVLFAVDMLARWRSTAAYNKVDNLLKLEDESQPGEIQAPEPRTPDQIRQLVGRNPDQPLMRVGKDEFHETYSWRGIFRSYYVYVIYQAVASSVEEAKEADPLLQQVLQNERPQNAPAS
jgi:hypothetical protein